MINTIIYYKFIEKTPILKIRRKKIKNGIPVFFLFQCLTLRCFFVVVVVVVFFF